MVTEEDNATIERMITEGKSAISIRAAVPSVSRTNVYLKISKFKKHGTVGRVQTKTLGRPRIMGEGVDNFIKGLLAVKPNMELEEMRKHMQTQLHMTVSMSTISRAITRAGVNNGRPLRTRNSASGRRRVSEGAAASSSSAAAQQDHQLDPQQQQQQPDSNEMTESHIPLSAHTTQDLSHIENDHTLDGDDEDVSWGQMQSDTSSPTTTNRLRQTPQQQHPLHQQQQQLQMQQQHQQQQNDLQAIDPLLAQAYSTPAAAAYQSIYPDLSKSGQQQAALAGVGMGLGGSPAGLDIYRSPYAPVVD
ncbi:hypothetical protein AAFC00_003004 [Neodothiora populina]